MDRGDPANGRADGRPPAPSAVRVSLVAGGPNGAAAPIVVGPGDDPGHATVDGLPIAASLRWLDGVRARLETEGDQAAAAVLLLAPSRAAGRSGVLRREVVVDGWRFEVDVEPEARAALRERASRAAAAQVRAGPFEVRAVIPGRIVSVEVVAGDPVVAGQRVMIIEAMKMQNELRVPRDGTVGRIAAGAGETIEVGDVLLVLE
jgi:biotin carboxyl carrier protein